MIMYVPCAASAKTNSAKNNKGKALRNSFEKLNALFYQSIIFSSLSLSIISIVPRDSEINPSFTKYFEILQTACETEDDDLVRNALREVVPTFKKPEEVNIKAEEAAEMHNQRELITA